MSLDLSAEQPADEGGAVSDPNPEPQVFATLVSEDGRLLKMARGANGILVLQISRNEPFILDRFQAAAFSQAASSIEKVAP